MGELFLSICGGPRHGPVIEVLRLKTYLPVHVSFPIAFPQPLLGRFEGGEQLHHTGGIIPLQARTPHFFASQLSRRELTALPRHNGFPPTQILFGVPAEGILLFDRYAAS